VPGWLPDALDTFFAPVAPEGSLEFRVGNEVGSLVDGQAVSGPAEDPDVVLEAAPADFYFLFTERRWDGIEVRGDRTLLERMFDAAAPVEATVAA
jgi:hypothetical protein